MAIIIPQNPIVVQHPQETPTEVEKFANNGDWFFRYAQWICWNYYNTFSIQQNYLQNSGSGIVTSSGSTLSTQGTRMIVDEMLENYDYYDVNQQNLIFNHLTTSSSGVNLPNIWIQGGEVRQLCDHILGKGIKQIEPIEKTISADSISENSLLKKQEVLDKIDLGAKIGDVLNELGGGDVRFAPAGNIDYSNPSAVKEAKDKVRGEYQNTATVIARYVYYRNKMEEQFKMSVLDTVLANLTGMEFPEKNGELITKNIPGYCGIYDFSTWGEYGEGQTKAGYIVPVTLEEIIHEYTDMNPEWIQQIQDVLYNQVDGNIQFMDYYNQPFRNVLWWNNNQKWISKAVVYWLAPMDTRYQKKKNQFGGKKVQMIDENKVYQIDTGRKEPLTGKRIFESKKGSDIKGDSSVWMVHKAVVLGNKYLLEYGYDSYQVRPFGDKSKPEIPIKWLCQGKIAGYVKPIASRLKPKQAEIDAVRYRIREYMSQDMGKNYIFNGGKLGENLTAKDIVDDFKTYHVTVLPPTGDSQSDKMGINDLVRSEDMTNHTFVQEYLTLKNDIMKEMQAIIGASEISLGDQSSTIGKGVQQETINRSELSGLNLYHSLNEYWRRCIQFGANKAKMIMLDQQNKNVILPISNRETKILTLTKEFRYEDLQIYLSPDDAINTEHMAILKQALIAYAVNPVPEGAEAIYNIMKLLQFKSFGEGISHLGDFIEKKKQETDKVRQQEMASEHIQQSTNQQSVQILQHQKEIAELTSKLSQIQLQGIMNMKVQEAKAGQDRTSKLDDIMVEQITALIQNVINPQPQEAAPAA